MDKKDLLESYESPELQDFKIAPMHDLLLDESDNNGNENPGLGGGD